MAITVPIVSEWNPQGLDKSLSDFQRAEGGWAKAGVAVEKATLPAAAALGILGAAGIKAVHAAEEAAAVNAKLSQVFKSIGYEENTQAAMDYADALSKQIGVDDEVIKTAQTKLATFSEIAKSTDNMARSTKLAADLSAAGFGSMDSAAVMLGKALQNPIKGVTALTRVGVSLTDQQAKQVAAFQESGKMAKAQEIIFGAVEKQVGGVAEASATSSAKMSVAFGEVVESIGTALLPAFEKLAPVAQKFAEWAGKNGPVIAVVGVAIAGLAASILALAGTLKVISMIQTMVTLMKEWEVATKLQTAASKVQAVWTKAVAAAQWLWNIALSANPIGLIIIAIVALVAVFVLLWTKCETFRKIVTAVFEAVWSVIKTVWQAIKSATAAVWGWISDFLEKHWDAIRSAFESATKFVSAVVKKAWDILKTVFKFTPWGIVLTNLDKLKGWFSAAWDWIKDKARVFWDFLKSLFKVTPFGVVITNLDKIKSAFSSAFDWIVDKAEAFWETLTGIFDKIGSGFSKVGDVIGNIPGLGSVVPGSTGAPVAAGLGVVPVSRALIGGVPQALGNGDGARFATASRRTAPTIVINGALDPEGVARQVKRMLGEADVRHGRAPSQPRAVAW